MTLARPRETSEILVEGLNNKSIMLLEQVLRQVSDNLTSLNHSAEHLRETQEKMSKEVHESSLRIVRLEGRDERIKELQSSLGTLEAKIAVLSDYKVKKESETGVFTFILQNWAGFTALAVAVAAFLRYQF